MDPSVEARAPDVFGVIDWVRKNGGWWPDYDQQKAKLGIDGADIDYFGQIIYYNADGYHTGPSDYMRWFTTYPSPAKMSDSDANKIFYILSLINTDGFQKWYDDNGVAGKALRAKHSKPSTPPGETPGISTDRNTRGENPTTIHQFKRDSLIVLAVAFLYMVFL